LRPYIASFDGGTDFGRDLPHPIGFCKKLLQNFAVEPVPARWPAAVLGMLRCDVGSLAPDTIGIAELFVASRDRMQRGADEQLGRLGDLRARGLQLLSPVRHHEIASQDDLVSRPVNAHVHKSRSS
jgi:hypothetical protein